MSVNRQSVENRGGMAGRGLGAWMLGLAALALAVPALRADDAGPAARAVRLSSVDGQVQLSQGNQVTTATAVANTPLFEGTIVTTADDGRAEIQFEDGSVARLSPNTALTLAVLRGTGASGEAEIDLNGGLGYFELQGDGQAGTIRVKFGDSVVTASGYSVLRINLDTPPGELAVFSGNAHLERGSAVTVDLHGGESVALNANDASRYTLNETIEPDSWDSWNSDRDQALTSAAATATGATKDYANGSNPAWNDLDANGNWYNVPGQGNIWSPYEASNSGWEPYGNGYWMNSPGYGYMWVSGDAWGYLPYQCGMWNWYDSFGWGWAPGFGGCNPWWFGGIYYGPNIGRGFGGYRPPMRPHPPRHPFGGTGLIAVNRRVTGIGGTLPNRDKTSVVTIAGHTVLPLHPLSLRPQYDHSASGFVNRTVVTNVGGVPATGQPRGPASSFVAGRPGSAPALGARNSGGSQHSASAGSASHASSGGGAPRTSGGGGGGFSGGSGGGASHGGGGGGGGGSHH
ncbi:MAG TPA: FecR family protein [Terracidiphilus sp.]|nr:FecR family protein [Terracidiphilus sp.]